MADDERPEPGSSYRLLFSDPIVTLKSNKATVNVRSSDSLDYSEWFYGPNTPKMLCFGAYKKGAISSEIAATAAATLSPMVSQSDSSSATSGHNSRVKSRTVTPNPNSKGNVSGQNPVDGGSPAERKRARSEKPSALAGKPKPRPARKEKIGQRIATLQQLVSPFGKTDTASVLHEAMAYTKFLHDQVRVLSSPYLQPSQYQVSLREGGAGLRSRGLCLVPVSCIAQVVEGRNGADFWAPAAAAAGMNDSSCVNLASSVQH